MAITLDGTKGGTASAGWYGQSAFTGTFTDGIVVDYTTGMGRISVGSSDGLTIYNGGVASSALLTLDSSGNLGLGVTPSAGSGRNAIQIGAQAYLDNAGGAGINISGNAYYNGGWKYLGTNKVCLYQQDNAAGVHGWFIAGSGTAGNAISFTQAMTLDASGNLGIGTSSPGSPFEIVRNSSSGGSGLFPNIRLDNQNASGYTGLYFLNSGTQKAGLEVKNDVGALQFFTGSTERARINGSGNLLVGNTTAIDVNTERLQVYYTYPTTGATWYNTSTNTTYAICFRNPNGLMGNITTTSTTTQYNAASDQRLKENIVDAPGALSSINAVKVRSFDWKSDGSHTDYGYIAQELLEVAPEAVSVPADPDEMMGVDFGRLTPRLVKAIQELSAELNELKAQVNA